MTPEEQAQWDARKQPACGYTKPHLPHNGFAGGPNRDPDPWCYGVPNEPRGVTLDDRLFEAFKVGFKAADHWDGMLRDDYQREVFEQWKKSLLP